MRPSMIAILASSILASVPIPAFAQDNVGEAVFRVPLGQVVPSTSIDPVYSWIESASSCSTSCGSGTRTTTYQCQNVASFDVSAGNFGAAEDDAQCVSTVGPKPSGSTSACSVYSSCTFDWVKPAEVVTPIQIDDNPIGRPGCGQVRREFDPRCERVDGTVMASSDHGFCRNDLPDYTDVANGLPDALGYDRTRIETASCNPTDHDWLIGSWSGWSSGCSTTALRTRTVACERKFDASPAPDASCAGPKPATSEVGAQYGSCTFAAEFGSWGGWDSECSTTSTRTRTVQCRRSNGDAVPTAECTSRGISVSPTSETQARYGNCTYSRVSPEAWSSWSSTCSASATRTRAYDCRRSNGDIVADSECTSRGISLSESENQAVYSGCSYAWATGAWSGFSSTCSSGATRTRAVTCRRDPLGTTVADSYCTSGKPATSEVVAQYGGCSYAPANWSGWSAWSSTCSASATRTQSAQCRRSDGSIVATNECTSRGISLSQSEAAPNYSGCGYSANFGAWGGWSSACSTSAIRTRTASCRRSDGSTVADTECTSRGIALTPTSEVSAQYGGCGYSASFGAWSGWSSACSASATRTRSATCYRSDGTAVGATECTSRGVAMGPTSETAAQYGGCGYSVSFGAWSGWSSTCSPSASRTRSATCYRSDGTAVGGTECTSRGIVMGPTSETSPQYGGCSYSASLGGWSACTSGSQSRSVTCIRSDGASVPTSYCGYSGNPSSEAQSCATYAWSSGAWSGWSTCSAGSQLRTRAVTCEASPGGTVGDSYCGGGKPAPSETQSCASTVTVWLVFQNSNLPCGGVLSGANSITRTDIKPLDRPASYRHIMTAAPNTRCIVERHATNPRQGFSYTFTGYTGDPVPTPDWAAKPELITVDMSPP